MIRKAVCAAALALSVGAAGAAPSVVFSDVLGGSYSQFNGFEGIGAATLPAPPVPTYVEGGLKVEQINADAGLYSIWTNCPYTSCYAGTGSSWYANGGDYGYTRITEADGADFGTVSLSYGNGWGVAPGSYLNYLLRLDGATVLSGSAAFPQVYATNYLSFLGGGFDEVLLSSTMGNPSEVTSAAYQALAIDNIKAAGAVMSPVPEPGSIAMLLGGLAFVGGIARRRQAASARE